VCAPGVLFCLDGVTSAQCSADGTAYRVFQDCTQSPGLLCNASSGACYACVPNETYCIDQDFQGTCNSAGTGNSSFVNCQSVYGTGCDAVTGHCVAP